MLGDGYGVYPGILTQDDLDDLTTGIGRAPPRRTRAGVRHLMGIEAVAGAAQRPNLVDIARQWLGDTAIPFRATLFDKSPDANWLVAWHQDTALPIEAAVASPGWGPFSQKAGITYAHAPSAALERVIALRIHIDDSDDDNGPLRVLPGTHSRGVMSDAEVHECALRVPAETCRVRRGGVVAMRPLLVHASSKALTSRPRRVLHVEYAPALQMDGFTLRVA